MATAKPNKRKRKRKRKPLPRKSQRGTVRKISPSQLRKQLEKQKFQRKLVRQEKQAFKAKASFRVRKADKGKIIFIGTKGERDATRKGRKGYLIYVTKSGKKQLLKQKTRREPYKASTITDLNIPLKKKLRIAQKQFFKSRLVKTQSGREVVKAKGSFDITGAWDFSDSVVTKLAKPLRKALEAQRSRRSFLIRAMVLIELEYGSEKTYEINVPIDRSDNVAIKLAGVENFIRYKFYAYMARELAFDGYVTSGSSNHVARLKQNQGEERQNWTQDDGNKWRGNESQVVKIREIQWQILQAQ